MMATDEEITTEAEKQFGAWIRCDNITSIKLLERVIKRGIQIERERIRKQVKKDGNIINTIEITDIDIWDDVK